MPHARTSRARIVVIVRRARVKEETTREPSRSVCTFHIAGFQFHDGAEALGRLRPGAALDMEPERDNPHDADAVALSFEGVKLGYVPAGENGLISVMAYYGHADAFEARVLQVDPEAVPWRQVMVGVRIVDAR